MDCYAIAPVVDVTGLVILGFLVFVFLFLFDFQLITVWVRRWLATNNKLSFARNGILLCLLLIGCGIVWDQIGHSAQSRGFLVMLVCSLPVVRLVLYSILRSKDRDTDICSLMLALTMAGTLWGSWSVFQMTSAKPMPRGLDDSLSYEAYSEAPAAPFDSDSGVQFATILYEEPGSFDFFRRGTVLTKDQTKYVREYFEKQKRQDMDVFFTTRSDGRLVRR